MNAFRNVFDGIVNNWHSESQSNDIKMSEFDFILETGDISQNGRRRPELTKIAPLCGNTYSKPF